jgi:hypothetical protein
MKRKYPLKQSSGKEAAIKREYARVCRKIDQDMIEDFGYIRCGSCHMNLTGKSWGHSHNLPKGRFKSLETDPRNITPRCQDWLEHKGCHEKLDKMKIEDIVKFKDFAEIMEYRFDASPEEYNKMVMAIIEAGLEINIDYYEE